MANGGGFAAFCWRGRCRFPWRGPVAGLPWIRRWIFSRYNCQTWGRRNGLPVNGVSSITQTKDGYIWVGSAIGLIRFDGTEFRVVDLGQLPEAWSSGIVDGLSSARNGGLWVGLESSSYGFFDGRTFSFRTKDAWSHVDSTIQYVRSVLESKSGTLWLGTDTAVLRVTESGGYEEVIGSSTNALNQAPINDVFDCSEDREGRIWFGTQENGVYCWQAGKVFKIPDPDLNSVPVLAVAEDQERQIWVATQVGLRCYDANLVRKDIPALNMEVRALLADRNGGVWIGTTGQGLALYRNGAYSFLRKTNGLASDYVRGLAEDREGSLWVGTREGFSQLTDVKFPTQPASEFPFAQDAVSVAASHKGGIWVGSVAGLTYYDGKPKTYGVETGLTNPYTKRVFEASDGDVYIVSGIKYPGDFFGREGGDELRGRQPADRDGRGRAGRSRIRGRFPLPRGQELFHALSFYQRRTRSGVGSQPGFRPGRGDLGCLQYRGFLRQEWRVPAMGGGARAF